MKVLKFKNWGWLILASVLFTWPLSVHRPSEINRDLNPKLVQTFKGVNKEHLHMAYKVGSRNNVDPLLILTIIGVESSFKSTAKSRDGAIGYMQVVPKWHMNKIDYISHLYDGSYNIEIGTKILKEYIDSSKSLEHALQRYNGSVGSTKYSNLVLTKYMKLKETVYE